MKNLVYLVLGALFGVILTKSEVMSWFRIHDMFLLREAHMYLIIGSAIVVGAISVQILKRLKLKSLNGEEIKLQGKSFHKGTIIGGALFGIGWAITGACPGPIFAQIGTGAYPALFTLAGAVVGAMLYHFSSGKLPR